MNKYEQLHKVKEIIQVYRECNCFARIEQGIVKSDSCRSKIECEEEPDERYCLQAGPVSIEVRIRATTELERAAARYRKSYQRAPYVALENVLLESAGPPESVEAFEAALNLLRVAGGK